MVVPLRPSRPAIGPKEAIRGSHESRRTVEEEGGNVEGAGKGGGANDDGGMDLFGDLRLGHDDGAGDAEGKLEWLRSQVIGKDAEFESPFGRRRITYCDLTASGRFLQVVEDYLRAHVYPFYGNTHTGDSYVGLHTSHMVQEASRYLKRSMGAGSHDLLFFCGTGCTAAIKRLQEVMGLAVPPILRSLVLSHLPTSDRWVVLVGPYEHHSNLLSWRQSLAEVVEISLDRSGAVDVDALKTTLESPEYAGRPKLGSFSACSNVTGIHCDTRAIARVLHEHGAYACFDFACSGPYVGIEMRSGESDGYDAVFLSPHKFLGGPGSPGLLLMSDELYRLKNTPPSTSGGGTVVYVNGYSDKDTLYCEDVEEREDAGTPAIVQKIRAALAFRVKRYIGHELIREREATLAAKAVERMSANPNVFVLGDKAAAAAAEEEEEDRQSIVSFLIYPEGSKRGRHLHCRFVTILLNDLFGIQARGGCACAGPYGHALLGICPAQAKLLRSTIEKGYQGVKPGFTRVGFSYYASSEEVDFILDAIDFVAANGHRFLSLYDFDWRTGDWRYSGSVNDTKREMVHRSHSSGDRDPRRSCECYFDVAKSVVEELPLPLQPRQTHLPGDVDADVVTFIA